MSRRSSTPGYTSTFPADGMNWLLWASRLSIQGPPPPLPGDLQLLHWLAVHNKVVCTLGRHAERGLLPIPEELVAKWRKHLAETRYEALQRELEFLRLEKVFAKAGLQWMTIKGPRIRRLVYPPDIPREYLDFDIIIRSDRYSALAALMTDRGYRSHSNVFSTLHRHFPPFEGRIVVEAHPHEASVNPAADWLWRQALERNPTGNSLEATKAEHLLYLCHHALVQHRGDAPLRTHMEIAALACQIESKEISWMETSIPPFELTNALVQELALLRRVGVLPSQSFSWEHSLPRHSKDTSAELEFLVRSYPACLPMKFELLFGASSWKRKRDVIEHYQQLVGRGKDGRFRLRKLMEWIRSQAVSLARSGHSPVEPTKDESHEHSENMKEKTVPSLSMLLNRLRYLRKISLAKEAVTGSALSKPLESENDILIR